MPDDRSIVRTIGTHPIESVTFDQWLALWRGYTITYPKEGSVSGLP